MSDPLKQMEIEDVLSSIRRLVANGSEQQRTPSPAPEKPAAPERLVLTPAQRIEVVEDPAPEAEVVAKPEVAVEPQPVEAPEADMWEEISLEDRIAELEAAIADVQDDWEPDGSETARQHLNFADINREPVGTFHVQAEAEDEDDQDQAVSGADPGADEFDPDAEAATLAGNMFAGDSDDADVLDEETLRQMVNDIVREELQGALGERITRNVRKLVRREINRALASREFE